MIQLRPHHVLCAQSFIGKGYSKSFCINFKTVLDRLQSGMPLKLVNTIDDICSACPHNISGSCETNDKVISLDESVLEVCDLQYGAEFTYNELTDIINKKIITPKKIEQVCKDCQWLEICLGYHYNI